MNRPVDIQLPVAPLGAIVSGATFRVPSAATTITLKRLVRERLVVVLKDAADSPNEHCAIASLFGEPVIHPYLSRRDGHPEITVLEGDRPKANTWHTDGSYLESPPEFTVLRMVTPASSGGDTLWSNQESAFATLPTELKRRISGLEAAHRTPDGDQVATHPLVRPRQGTGTPVLFANRTFTTEVIGLAPSIGAELLERLFTHGESPDFQYRHKWDPGDVAIWDNTATQHCVVSDYDTFRRIERITVVARSQD